MIISAYDVSTEARGFAACSWPATTLKAAHTAAKSLSIKLANDLRYPNAFWVSDGKRSLGKYFRGEFFPAGATL